MNRERKLSQIRYTERPHHNFTVQPGQEEGGLLAFLCNYALQDKSRTSVKQLLGDRYISVNNVATTQWDYALQSGDVVTLNPRPLPTELHHKQVDIIWQDEHLVLIHKSSGIPTVASGEEKDITAMQVVSKHLKKFNPHAKVFLLNRIDKDSAGFVLMAKTTALQKEITDHWNKYILHQTFAVVVEGKLSQNEGYLAAPMDEDKLKHRKTSQKGEGASTAGQARYRCLNQTELGALLRVELISGRNNRLRKQFAQMRCPIVGDWRNGSSRKSLGYVALDSISFGFIHPITGKRYNFEQPISGRFRRLLKP